MRRGLFDFLFVASPKVLGGAATLALNLVLIRYFGPEQFGIYSLCVAAILLADAVLGSALDFGVLRLAPSSLDSDGSRSLEVQRVALALKFAAAVTAWLLLILFAGTISSALFHARGYDLLLYLTCATVVTLLLFRSAQVQLQVAGRFRAYALLDMAHVAVKFGGIAAIIPLGWISVGRTLVMFALAPAAVFLGWAASYGRPLLRTLAVKFSTAKELVSYVKWFLLTFALANVLVRMDVFLLTRWSGLRQVGVYSAGQVFAFIPQLLGVYLAVILSPRIMPYRESGQLAGFFRRYHRAAALAGIVIYIAARLGVQLLGPTLLPHAFVRSAHVIVILLPGAVAGFLLFPVAIPLLMFLRPKFLFTMDLIALPFLIVAYRQAIPAGGAEGAAWVTCTYACVKGVIAFGMAWYCASQSGERPTTQPVAVDGGSGFPQPVEILEGGPVL